MKKLQENMGYIFKNPELLTVVDKNTMVSTAITTIFTNGDVGALIGAIFVGICLTFFAFSTIISWNLFGRINFEYLFGKKSTIIYSIISIIFTFLGATLGSDLVWNFNDFFNYLMVIPNVLGLIPLAAIVSNASKKESPLK